ncbi:MAG: DM13 domain-containing protein [Phycisphaerae bacterium]|nr:DM13 domain-containing protein [Phycisphaerae bacterium]
MNRKVVALVAGAGLLVVGWAAFRPELLFIDQRVNEDFPVAAAVAMVDMPTSEAPMLDPIAQDMKDAKKLAEGTFHGVAHETKGTATIYQLADGRRFLRFTGFDTSNGPDLRVIMTTATDATDSDTIKNAKERVELAKLKGNVGDQNYELPKDVDLAKFKSVTVWCNRFSVNFATAPLK